MAFNLNIKNIGKLADANLRIGQFTVLAGPNNTGKSTVSKLLYSIFDAINANSTEAYINDLINPIRDKLRRLARLGPSSNKKSPLNALIMEGENLGRLVRKQRSGDMGKDQAMLPGIEGENREPLDIVIFDLVNGAEKMQAMLPGVSSYLRPVQLRPPNRFPPFESPDRILGDVKQLLTDLQEGLKNKKANELFISATHYKIRENLIQNFQVPDISYLMSAEDRPSEIAIDGLGKFQLSNGDVSSGIDRAGLEQLQQYSGVIYLESPVYWKLKNALEILRTGSGSSYGRRVRLIGVPGYFYDLANKLKYEYTGDIAFPGLYEKLTGKDVLGGKIALSESGDLSFQENGRRFSLPVTAMGVANLGILALLIEHKVLDEDSFLFIDEPEAHLHPAWQVIMAETLLELAKGGVHVVIATHSIDVLKWLEVHVKENPEDKELIALNRFPVQSQQDTGNFDDEMAKILEELTEPFSKTFFRGI